MSRKIANNLDLMQNQILQMRVENLASAPSSPQPGQVWYDTTAGCFMLRAASTNVDLRARANHTGQQLSSTISDFDTAVRLSRLDQFAVPTAPVNVNSQKITNLANGTTTNDGVNYSQLQAAIAQITATRLDQFAAPTSAVNLNAQKITSLANGSASGDAVNYSQLSAAIAQITTTRLDQMAAPTTSLNLNSQKIINLADGSNAQDAATYGQLMALVNGTDWKPSVRVATTGNVTLSGLQTIDSVTLTANQRVLVRANTAQAENRIWLAQSGAWTPAPDSAQGALTASAAVFVEEGATYADTQWRLLTNDPITVGTTALAWAQIGAGSSYTNGAGLTLVGSTFAIDTAVVVRKYAQDIGDNSATSIAVTHGLGTLDVTVAVFLKSDGSEITTDVVHTSANVVTIVFATAPATAAYRVVVHG